MSHAADPSLPPALAISSTRPPDTARPGRASGKDASGMAQAVGAFAAHLAGEEGRLDAGARPAAARSAEEPGDGRTFAYRSGAPGGRTRRGRLRVPLPADEPGPAARRLAQAGEEAAQPPLRGAAEGTATSQPAARVTPETDAAHEEVRTDASASAPLDTPPEEAPPRDRLRAAWRDLLSAQRGRVRSLARQRMRGRILDRFGQPFAAGLERILEWLRVRRLDLEFVDMLERVDAAGAEEGMLAEAVSATYAARMRGTFLAAGLGGTATVEGFTPRLRVERSMLEIDLEVSVRTVTAAAPEGEEAAAGGTEVESLFELRGRFVEVNALFGLFDPVVLDLAGDGVNLRGAEEGVRFDLAGDGRRVETGFVRGDDALLYLDRDGDGRCSDGTEFFGNMRGAAHGFEDLARHDANGDGRIDAADPVYGKLRLFNDWNGDGEEQNDEGRSLEEAGIRSIGLDAAAVDRTDRHGNRITHDASFTRLDGSRGRAVDAWFRHRR